MSDRRLARLDARAAALAARSARLSRWRIALALASVALALAVGYRFGAGAGWSVAGVGALVFAVAARHHERVERARTRLARWRAVHARHAARRRLDWDALGPAPAPAPPGHPFAADLDLAGPRSLLHLVDTTATQPGHARLRAWLLETAPDPAAVRQRQARVRALVPRAHLRDRLELAGRSAGQPDTGAPRADAPRWSDVPLRRWLDTPPDGTALLRWALALTVLSALTVGLALAGQPAAVWSFLAYVALYLSRLGRFADALETTLDLQQALAEIRPALAFLERTAPTVGPVLAPVWAPVAGDAAPRHLDRRLRRLEAAAALTRNDVLRVVLNAALPYDLWMAYATQRVRARLAGVLPGWLDAWAEAEALSAWATHADLHADAVSFPDLADVPPADDAGVWLEATALGHPLVPSEGRVTNDVALGAGEVVVLTGSNMAGKSTWLRSVGVATAVAWAGGPVTAAHLRVVPLRPFASMRVGDALQEGVSTFYAEVRRLRALLDAVETPGPPVLVLIDEMYRGTNNRERLAGARALVRRLAGAPATSLVATHDLALTQLAGAVPGVRNAHVREHVSDGRLVFDYRLRDGPSPSTNALVIMAAAGLPTEPPDEAV